MNQNETNDFSIDLADLAQAIRLREGVEGVQRALWVLYSQDIPSTRVWSAELRIPVPVLAALRGELERRNVIESGRGYRLTNAGRSWLAEIFSIRETISSTCPSCQGSGRVLPSEIYPILEEFSEICADRPAADVTLDQSHATPETGIRKALMLLEKGLLAEPLLFLGDDDLISVACHLMRRRFASENAAEIRVLDIDTRYLDYINTVTSGDVATQQYDVREAIPQDLPGKFKVAFTDPAYTSNALTAFSFRCMQALQKEGLLLLSMPVPDLNTYHHLQKQLISMNFVLQEIHPNFNQYFGASLHAHVSTLFVCQKTVAQEPNESSFLHFSPFYTGETRITGGIYECTLCDTIYKVGPGEEYITVQELKEAGCHECGNTFFRRLGSRSSDSDPSSELNLK